MFEVSMAVRIHALVFQTSDTMWFDKRMHLPHYTTS